MKIKELTNAPQWLMDAIGENEDVEVDRFGRVTWRGGVWCDGVWRGGEWCGGVWRGGVWRGGVWRGGVWCDGVWGGGEWCGGEWRGGEWRGEKLTKQLLSISGLHWRVTISDTRMQIGCELHALADWAAFDDARITGMDGHALRFWRGHKESLLGLARAAGRGSKPETETELVK